MRVVPRASRTWATVTPSGAVSSSRATRRPASATADGAKVLFSFRGRTVFEAGVGKQILHVTFEAEDERYLWLNTSVCVLEGLIDSQTGRMKARIYECLNELGDAASQSS